MKRFLYTLAFVLANIVSAMAQFETTPAFPGADGFGRYASGGRDEDGDCSIYHVTNLNDEGQGSFRFGAATGGKKIIVFDVSGTIHLKKDLKILGTKTILGQTAPGDGICIADYPVTVGGSNVIIRYLRFRLGDIGSQAKAAANPNYEGDDALGGKNCSNVIIDHCSVSWSTDECCSFYGNTDFTMQYCIISESLKSSVHAKGSHGYGGIWGGKSASFHHNLIMHHDSRNPRFDHDYVSTLKGPVDYVNNVLYNWGGNSAYGGESGNGFPKYINMIKNYCKYGPATSAKTRLLNPTTSCNNCSDPNNFPGSVGYVTPGQFYITGNYMYGSTEVTNNNLGDAAIDPDKGTSYSDWVANYAASTRAISTDYDFDQYNVISTHNAETAFSKVLHYAGACYKRDEIDRRLRYEALNGLAYYHGSNGSKNGMIDSQNDVGGWPVLASEAKPTDSDDDGMPDEWETAHGLNPNSKADALSFSICENDPDNTHNVMYTNLEVYANSLVQEITQKERNDATETFDEYYPLGLLPVGGDDPFPTEPDFEIHEIVETDDVFNASKATSEKNVDILGTSCALDGSANPSGSSGAYLKLRTNSDWTFKVNSGYKITGINIVAYQHQNNNGTTAEIKMTSITADDGDNLLNSEVSLPQQSTGNVATVNLDGLSATNNVTVKFSNNVPSSGSPTPQQQCYAIVTITYEKSTGIEEVFNKREPINNNRYYNLAGQRVSPNTKGFIIHKGKKIFR